MHSLLINSISIYLYTTSLYTKYRMSNNSFLLQSKVTTDNDEIDDAARRHTISLSDSTYQKMKARGSFGMTWDDLCNSMIEQLDHKELPEGEGSF